MMKLFKLPSVAIRLQMIVVIALVSLGILAGITTYLRYGEMREAKIAVVRSVVEQVISLAANLQRQVEAGTLTHEQAFKAFHDIVGPMRYDNGNGYIFVSDYTGHTLVVGPTPQMEGRNRMDERDAHGNYLIRDLTRTAEAGGGTTTYYFPKPGAQVASEKLSLVIPFKPWGVFVASGIYVDELRAQVWAGLWRLGGVVLVLILLTAGVAWLVSRSITHPLGRLQRSMGRLAQGDLASEVPETERRDELGEMARAVEVFKRHAVERAGLEAERRAQAEHARQEKQQAMASMADAFERSVGSIVGTVATASTQMETTARGLSKSADGAIRQAATVADASTEASSNVQMVAAATEELSASIAEITRRVSDSSQMANRAVDNARKMDATVRVLSGSAEKIGAVVALIKTISSQTNLLALNATIEAARAGESGKGFAVVASEVKHLASQTAKATEDIASHIEAIQSSTRETVRAIEEIGNDITQMSSVAANIAAAVEQQGAATREIAGNVNQAASKTGDVSKNIAGVTRASGDIGTAANEVLGAAGQLSAQAERLEQEVKNFLLTVKAAA
jgi:methyl-accepting chemotaxis protein